MTVSQQFSFQHYTYTLLIRLKMHICFTSNLRSNGLVDPCSPQLLLTVHLHGHAKTNKIMKWCLSSTSCTLYHLILVTELEWRLHVYVSVKYAIIDSSNSLWTAPYQAIIRTNDNYVNWALCNKCQRNFNQHSMFCGSPFLCFGLESRMYKCAMWLFQCLWNNLIGYECKAYELLGINVNATKQTKQKILRVLCNHISIPTYLNILLIQFNM